MEKPRGLERFNKQNIRPFPNQATLGFSSSDPWPQWCRDGHAMHSGMLTYLFSERADHSGGIKSVVVQKYNEIHCNITSIKVVLLVSQWPLPS